MQIIRLLLPFYILCILSTNVCKAETYTYETKLKFKQYCKDYVRGKAQITFRKNYQKLLENQTEKNQIILQNIHQYRQSEMENAFKHAFVSAKLTYIFGEKKATKAGYIKELKSYEQEIKNFGGKQQAYLDTNCDLWNGQTGINYALNGKIEHKSFKKVGNQIFDNMTHPNSDFIIDYKNDTRRWDSNTNPDNMVKIIDEKLNALK